MSTWKTTETRTETVDREWRLTVTNAANSLPRRSAEGGHRPLPADYISALRSEPEDVREEVMHALSTAPAIAQIKIDALQSSVSNERELRSNLEAQLATVTAERDALRAQLAGAADAIAEEDEPADWGCSVTVTLDGDRPRVGLVPQELPRGSIQPLWSPLPRVLAEIARQRPGALIAAADKLRPVAATDRETRALLALVDWTQGDGSRLLWRRHDGRIMVNIATGASPDTALALCARLGIEVPE